MQFGILGPLEVRTAGAVVEIRRGLPRTLLVALVLRAGQTVTSDALVELLWGDDQPQNPANALQIQISYLRKALGSVEQGAAQALQTRPGGYVLDVRPEDIDARRFERMVREATATATDGTAAALRRTAETLGLALAMWRGDALADVAGAEFAIGETTRLSELRWEAVEARNDALLALGRHRELIGELSRLVADHPLHERFHEQLMLALYRSERQAEALRAYDDARKVLVEELGLDPGPRLQRLEREILAQDDRLSWVPPPGAGDDGARRNGAGRDAAPARPAEPPRRASAPPIPITPLVGRDVEIERIGELLGRNRIVTLTGPAGAGKSRLAIELAHQWRLDRHLVYVDLAGIGDPQLVAPTVATALALPVPPDDDPVEVVARWVDEHQALLVLDTCEHVVQGAVLLASGIVRRSTTAAVLATSRRPLGIRGEVAWPVPPLALAPPTASTAAAITGYAAVTLFAERASAVRPSFAVSDANAADIAAICAALDGLPLAIELAAARADVLTPAAIRARLENRFALLVDGSADVGARQQTLRAAIDWSYELLREDERRLFALLSVFAGPFDLDAVIAVAGEGFRDEHGDPVDVLAGLVRQSVVMVAGDDRYRMLDSLRAYALERLGEDADTRRRHAEHYSDLAEQTARHVLGPEQLDWFDRAQDDLPNFREALTWAFRVGEDALAAQLAGSLAWFWTLKGMLDEALQVFRRAVAIESAPPVVRARILTGYGLLAASLGDLRGARDAGVRAVELAREGRDDAVLGGALNTLAVAQWALGELRAAAATHDEAIERFAAAHDVWGHGVCVALRARTAIDAGEPDAIERATRAVPTARASGDRHVLGLAMEQLARVALVSGDVATAKVHSSECYALHESIGYTEGMVAALHLLGRAHVAAGDLEGARALHVRALRLAHSIGHAAATCEAVEDLARVAVANDPADALRLLTAADLERERRGVTRRASGFEGVESVRHAAASALGAKAPLTASEATAERFEDVVHRLLA